MPEGESLLIDFHCHIARWDWTKGPGFWTNGAEIQRCFVTIVNDKEKDIDGNKWNETSIIRY